MKDIHFKIKASNVNVKKLENGTFKIVCDNIKELEKTSEKSKWKSSYGKKEITIYRGNHVFKKDMKTKNIKKIR
ncbi:MAG: hypothetical protein ABIF08_01460 [Nanoarchaeota archaeon]